MEQTIQIINTIVSILGFGAIIISLIRVRKSFKVNSTNSLYQELHNIHSTFIEHPKFRPIFYDNKEIDILKNKEDKLRAKAIAELFFDIFEHIYQLSGELNKKQRKSWRKYIFGMCRSSIYLTKYLESNLDLIHPNEFKNDVISLSFELKIKEGKNKNTKNILTQKNRTNNQKMKNLFLFLLFLLCYFNVDAQKNIYTYEIEIVEVKHLNGIVGDYVQHWYKLGKQEYSIFEKVQFRASPNQSVIFYITSCDCNEKLVDRDDVYIEEPLFDLKDKYKVGTKLYETHGLYRGRTAEYEITYTIKKVE